MGELKLDWPVWIGVVTENLEAQRRFYRDALGLRELEAGDDWVKFDLGSRRLLELLAKSDLPQYSERRCQVGFAWGGRRGVRPNGHANGDNDRRAVLRSCHTHR
jgi:catechol 2,3-dioxygenase-like lactoylglutathione lyase family enzyme